MLVVCKYNTIIVQITLSIHVLFIPHVIPSYNNLELCSCLCSSNNFKFLFFVTSLQICFFSKPKHEVKKYTWSLRRGRFGEYEKIEINLEKSKNKSKDTLSKLESRIEKLYQSPPQKDFHYFVKIRLNGTRANPHRLMVGDDVAKKKFMEHLAK